MASGRKLGNIFTHDYNCYSKIKKGAKKHCNRLIRRGINRPENWDIGVFLSNLKCLPSKSRIITPGTGDLWNP